MAFMSALYDPKIRYLVSMDEIRDALSDGQMVSKRWLLNSVKNMEPRNILVVGGWYGLLAHALALTFPEAKVTTLDLDINVTKVAGRVLDSLGDAQSGNMFNPALYAPYDMVVNTSLEHIADQRAWVDMLAPGTTVVCQSNNADYIEDHIGCHYSMDELAISLSLSKINYLNQLEFPQYTRYMAIGIK